MAAFSFFKKKGTTKRNLIIAGVSFVVFVIAAVNAPPADSNDVTENATEDIAEQEDVNEQEKTEDVTEQDDQEQNQTESSDEQQSEPKVFEDKPDQEVEEVQEKQESQTQENQQQSNLEELGLELVTVGRVVDGDTFVTENGRKVRLIGVNTPESTTRTEEYGKEASKYTTSRLEGQRVYMQRDVSETDRYGRLLRVVWFEVPTDDLNEQEIRNKMFNAELVLNGYAEPSTYPPDVKYSELFRKFAREAREKGTGLWAYGSEGTTKGDLDGTDTNEPPPATEDSDKDTTSTPPATNQKESYKNCTELRKVYPNGVSQDHPAYDSKHDRDKDGYACEK
ncbi:nuclease [Bacillus sp. HMF5848]|nr:nuclease [Bacillus sp. HMF5848]